MKIGIQGIRFRRAAGVVVTTGAVLASGALYAAPAQAAAPVPSVVAKGGFVINNANGKTLYTKLGDTRRSTGSTTKIMTAKVVLAQKN
ncbi:D-alanyl-D-alanine carboxypeptidase, partial [Streptomyces sp. NPDC057062]